MMQSLSAYRPSVVMGLVHFYWKVRTAMAQTYTTLILLGLLLFATTGNAFRIDFPEATNKDAGNKPVGHKRDSETAQYTSSDCIFDSCLSKYGSSGFEPCLDSCISASTPSSHTEVTTPAAKRQIDPLQACIEARCVGKGRFYGSCVFSRCINGFRLKNFKKRSWNDVMRTCIEFHCSNKSPGSIEYTICVQSKCGKIAYGKR